MQRASSGQPLNARIGLKRKTTLTKTNFNLNSLQAYSLDARPLFARERAGRAGERAVLQ